MITTVAGSLLGSGRLGLLPAAFDPPTTAHVELGDRAQRRFGLDQVVYVLCEAMPHKRVRTPTVAERLDWLVRLVDDRADRAASLCSRGLVIHIVQEFRSLVGEAADLFVIAGRDAAERFAAWDYGSELAFAEQLRCYRILVASRRGAYRVPPEHTGRILPFEIGARHDRVSSRSVRSAIRSGRPWSHLVPAEIREAVGAAYGGPG